MKELIEQFIVESRELVEQATGDLLALEQNSSNRARLDSAFRAFHTLKGGAGIIEFAEMARVLHAAEDFLGAARSGERSLSAAAIDDCLKVLDQVVEWLNAMDISGAVPAQASSQAEQLARRIFVGGTTQDDGRLAWKPSGDWLAGLLRRVPQDTAKTALWFRPDAQCFFRNEDPLELLAQLPGLLVLELQPATFWPALKDFDPFECNLGITALFSEPEEVISAAARAANQLASGQFGTLSVRARANPPEIVPAPRALLEAQLAALSVDDEESLPARMESARRVVANVFQKSENGQRLEQLRREIDGLRPLDGARELASLIRSVLHEKPDAFPVTRETDRNATGVEAARSLRVSVERIDALVRLVGELTVAKNALDHATALAASKSDPDHLAALLAEQQVRLRRLVGELQRSVLNIRVLPIRQAFQRFPKLVRGLAAEMGKQVTLITEGGETEADKAIVETLAEPLVHIVRNAIGHGIEDATERARLGKPAVATIRLSAAKVGDSIILQVADDGRGIDLEKVRRTARELGLVDDPTSLSDAAALDMLFAPGFSTVTEVSALSGRGVGMDAVRAAVERMGGGVRIETEWKRGTTVILTLPFSIMLTPVMSVEAGGQVFGIPLESVLESTRVPRQAIGAVGTAQALVHRDRTVPIIDLAVATGTEKREPPGGNVQIVIALADKGVCGFEVDQLGERMDIMLKPLEGLLAGLHGVSGMTILGDGRVMLILDLQELSG